ncbi:MAG: hypothetical protein DME46_09380 [Verrucomicrobia bacterium]|nr:MAG: hypothetical protein DME46_09380 [Verrucomicrobiota bacterium]
MPASHGYSISDSRRQVFSGERTRLACQFRRPAENAFCSRKEIVAEANNAREARALPGHDRDH